MTLRELIQERSEENGRGRPADPGRPELKDAKEGAREFLKHDPRGDFRAYVNWAEEHGYETLSIKKFHKQRDKLKDWDRI